MRETGCVENVTMHATAPTSEPPLALGPSHPLLVQVASAMTLALHRRRWTLRLLVVTWLLSPVLAWAQLDINQASEADLDSLLGVGPALTARILSQRSQAPFVDWADLMRRVKGIRAPTARRLAEQGVTVNGQRLDAGVAGEATPRHP